jgi:hypothetical protein
VRKLLGLALAAAAALAGCGTPEFRAERAVCTADWMERIPPVYEERLVNRTRYENRPTGVTTCTTTGGVETCVAEMRRVAVPYVAVETVDLRKPERDAQIEACTRRACVAKYGNAECAPPA